MRPGRFPHYSAGPDPRGAAGPGHGGLRQHGARPAARLRPAVGAGRPAPLQHRPGDLPSGPGALPSLRDRRLPPDRCHPAGGGPGPAHPILPGQLAGGGGQHPPARNVDHPRRYHGRAGAGAAGRGGRHPGRRPDRGIRTRDQPGARADRAGGRHRRLGADPRRERHRQGAGRARDPRAAAGGAREPFVAVNCAAISPEPARERAVRPREGRLHRRRCAPQAGRFELADGGTLFLDEIGEISPELQVEAAARAAGARVRARRRHRSRSASTCG